MTSKDRRDELRSTYERLPREGGVYVLRNTVTGRILIASTVDLASIRNRLEFGQSTDSTGVLDRRLVADARAHGIASFSLEVLDILPADSERDDAQSAADLKALEELWRDQLADQLHY